jgi:hypothetical protein
MANVCYSRRIDSDTPDMAVSHPNSTAVVGYPSAKWLLCTVESDIGMPNRPSLAEWDNLGIIEAHIHTKTCDQFEIRTRQKHDGCNKGGNPCRFSLAALEHLQHDHVDDTGSIGDAVDHDPDGGRCHDNHPRPAPLLLLLQHGGR